MKISLEEEISLVAAVKNGDKKAQDTLANYLLPYATRQARKCAYNGSHYDWSMEENFEEFLQVAYDLLTELLYKQKLRHFKGKCRLRTYVFRAVANRITGYQREKAKDREKAEESYTIQYAIQYEGDNYSDNPKTNQVPVLLVNDKSALAELKELMDWVISNFLVLVADKEQIRNILVLYCLEFKTKREISQLLNINYEALLSIFRRMPQVVTLMPGADELKDIICHYDLESGDLEEALANILQEQQKQI